MISCGVSSYLLGVKLIKKLILGLAMAGACLARSLTPDDQLAARDLLNEHANEAAFYEEYYAITEGAVRYYDGKELALRESASMMYFSFNSTEAFVVQAAWMVQMLLAMAENEQDFMQKMHLMGMANGYYEAQTLIGPF